MIAVLFAVVLLLLSGTARAEMSANELLRKYDAGNASQREYLSLLTSRTEDGMAWTNSFLMLERKEPIFCVPKKLTLTGAEVVEVIRKQIKARPDSGMMPVGLVMLFGLRMAFPCPPK